MEESQAKKNYSHICLNKRVNFLIKVLCEKQSVREAAKHFDIKFSTAKAILKLFKKEGRIGKPNAQIDNDILEQEDMLKKIVQLENTIKQQKAQKKEAKFQELALRLNRVTEEQQIQTKTELPTAPPTINYEDLAKLLSKELQFEQQRYSQLMFMYQQRVMMCHFQ